MAIMTQQWQRSHTAMGGKWYLLAQWSHLPRYLWGLRQRRGNGLPLEGPRRVIQHLLWLEGSQPTQVAGPLLHRTQHQPPGRGKWNLCKSRTLSNRILLDYQNNILTVLLRYTTKTIHLILKDKDTMLEMLPKRSITSVTTWILGAWDGTLVVQVKSIKFHRRNYSCLSSLSEFQTLLKRKSQLGNSIILLSPNTCSSPF